jgi:hypothetical protein
MPWNSDDIAAWEENANHAFDPFFTYTDRESYLAWTAEWKRSYADLTADIRDLKRARQALQRSGSYDRAAAAPLMRGKKLARALLALRRAAKRDSWARRNASQVA